MIERDHPNTAVVSARCQMCVVSELHLIRLMTVKAQRLQLGNKLPTV